MINLLPPHYVIGVDCHFRNGSPVNSERWDAFNRYKETMKITGKPIRFPVQTLGTYFNDVIGNNDNMVLRDSEFAFVSHMENHGFDVIFEPEKNSWLVQIKKT
jgi:hypothetical protein